MLSITTPFGFASAEDAVTLNEDGGLELSITANRRLQSINKTLAPVSVITREEIDGLQALDIIDVLRLQTGVDISRTGGAGSQTSVILRGAESDQVLVLVDGIRVSSVTTGSFDWSSISLDQIERIEVVRGSRTALYGSDAIGGIIQVFTRKNSTPYASVTLGKYGTKRASAGFSKGFNKTKVSLNVSAEESDGFSATNINAGEFSFNPDKDPYEKRSVTAAFSHQLTNSSKVGIDLLHSRNKADFDQGDSDTELQTLGAFLDIKVSERWSQKLKLSRTNSDLESASEFGISTFDTNRQTLNWQNDLKISDRTALILGLDYREDEGKSADYDEKIDNKAVYANITNQRGRLNLELSARYDKHSQAGNEVTGQIATGFELTPDTTLYASYGTAFKAPTINELFYPGFFGSFAGNPDLDPETSKTFELGIKSKVLNNQRLEANLFHTKVEDLISFSGVDNQAINNNEVTIKGLELGYSGNVSKFDWGLGATIQRAENDGTGESLIRRPNNKFTANLGYTPNAKTRLGLDASLVSSRIDNDFSSFPSERKKLDSYELVNLTIKQKLTKHTSLGLRVENILDDDYELANGFNTPGRGAFVTFSYR